MCRPISWAKHFFPRMSRIAKKVYESDMPGDLGDEGMAEEVDTVTRDTFTKERQPKAMTELSYHQPNQSSQQDHAPSYPTPSQDQG